MAKQLSNTYDVKHKIYVVNKVIHRHFMFLNVLNNLYINNRGTSLPQSRQLLLRLQPLLHPMQHGRDERVVSPEDLHGEVLNSPACLQAS